MNTLDGLTTEQRAVAMARFHILQPHLEGHIPLNHVAQQAGIAYRTAKRWLSGYRQSGLAGLARQPRHDKGLKRGITAALQQLVEGLALQKPPLSVAVIHRQASQFAAAHHQPVPSYLQTYRLVRELPTGLLTLAHQGSKVYSDHFDLVYRREADAPNAVWQADHTLLDILVQQENGEPSRPWLTIVIDDYSRAIAGYYLTWNAPSAIQTALALRQAIWRKTEPQWTVCGIPAILYVDNGSDFTSQHIEQVAADLKIRLAFSIPGKPRGRGKVERFFATLSQLFLSELPGYIGAGGVRDKQQLLPLSELEQRLRTFLLDTYHGRVHSETHQTPRQRWEQASFLPRLPDSLEQLDLLLLTVPRARKIRPDGIHFQNFRYVDMTLAAFVGETVVIRYDPRDMAEIRVFHQDKFLCRAICPELADTTVSLQEVIRARNRHRRELQGTLRERSKMVGELLRLKRSEPLAPTAEPMEPEQLPAPSSPPLKRYFND